MPITQDRLIDLAKEAIDVLRFYEDLVRRVRGALQAESDAQTLRALVEIELSMFQRPHMERAFAEVAYFRSAKSKNDYMRRYMQRKRGAPVEPTMRSLSSKFQSVGTLDDDPRFAKAGQVLQDLMNESEQPDNEPLTIEEVFPK